MVFNEILEELVDSKVADSEILYRSIKKNEVGCPELYRFVDQKLQISSSAFNDRSQQPSVDRAILQDCDPIRSKKSPSDGIVALLSKNIREEKIDMMNHNGKSVETTYTMDIKSDPIYNPPEINLAHALIIPNPDYQTKNAFNKIKERLAILASNQGWVVKPE